MSSRKRVRECPIRYVDTPPSPNKQRRGEFTNEENAELLAALLKYGPLDLGKLAEAIPTRNEEQVKQRIAVLQKKAQQSLTTVKKEFRNGMVKYESRDKVALDQWLDHLFHLDDKAQVVHGVQEDLHVKMLARSMGFIAKYEDHPKLEECGGVDVENVYKFMENMMMGLPSKTLKNADARFLIESLQRLSSVLDNADVGREESFLMCGQPQWRSKGEKPRTYGVNQGESENDEILKFLDSSKLNPFKVPSEWLKKNMS